MDQDTPSGGKGSWRDRLGISKDEAANNDLEASKTAAAGPVRTAPRAPMAPAAASRPAPMAPRAPLAAARPTSSAAASAPPRPTIPAPASPVRSAASEGLAERLRVQREAAERLAEQRLALARQRAAARVQENQTSSATAKLAAPAVSAPKAPEAPTAKAPEAPGIQPAPNLATTPAAPPAQPRFSFTADEITRAQRAPAAPAKPMTAAPPPRPAGQILTAPAPVPRAEPRLDGLKLRGSLAPIAPRAPIRAPMESKPPAPPTTNFHDDFEESFLEPSGSAYEPPRPASLRAPVKPASIQRDTPAALDEDQFFTTERVSGLENEPEPRKGPLLLLGSMLGVIVLFAIAIFIWQQLPSNTASTPVEADVPVVTAPAEPTKTVPAVEETATDPAAQDAAGKKQIYDRILGEEEQGTEVENVVPSEEAPVPQGADRGLTPTPEPVPPSDPMMDDNSLPIPAEPDGSDQSGDLDGGEADPFAAVLPVPAEAEMAAVVPARSLAAMGLAPSAAAPAAPEAAAPATLAPTPAPVVETPPPAPANVVMPRPRPNLKPLASATPIAPALPPATLATEQVASVDPVAPVATVTAYVAQLQTLNTEADAKAEFSRVRASHSAIVGSLTPVITKADLGTKGTIFRMGLGPLASKEAASTLCAQLIAAGEKDCIVRRQ